MSVCCVSCEVKGQSLPMEVVQGLVGVEVTEIASMGNEHVKEICCQLSPGQTVTVKNAAKRVLKTLGEGHADFLHPRYYQVKRLKCSEDPKDSIPLGRIIEFLTDRTPDLVIEQEVRALIEQANALTRGEGKFRELRAVPMYKSAFIELTRKIITIRNETSDGRSENYFFQHSYTEEADVKDYIMRKLLPHAKVSLLVLQWSPFNGEVLDVNEWLSLFREIYGTLDDMWVVIIVDDDGCCGNRATAEEEEAVIRLINRNVSVEYADKMETFIYGVEGFNEMS